MSPTPRPRVLSGEELERFRREGFLVVREAFDPEVALELQRAVWKELREDHGIDRDAPSTWRPPPRSPLRSKESRLNERMAGARFQGVVGDLLGRDDWQRPRTWGGFLVTFPDKAPGEWDVRADGWHWDGHPDADGLLVFSFYSEVRAGGGGTLLLQGSPSLLRSFYASLDPHQRSLPHAKHRALLQRHDPYLEDLTGRAAHPAADRIATFMERTTHVRGVPCRVVELTGAPGDAVFCNLGVLHSASHNAADVPRLMRTKFLLLGAGSTSPAAGPRRGEA